MLPLATTAKDEPSLSEAELRARIETTERSVRGHLAGLTNELAPGSFMLRSQPVADQIRTRPTMAMVIALSFGVALSVLLVLPRKRQTPEKKEAWRQALDKVSDRTGLELLRGSDLPEDLRELFGGRTPVVLVNSNVESDAAKEEPSSSMVRRAASAALKTTVGFAAKTILDIISEEAKASLQKRQASAQMERGPKNQG
ncbi:hypothetical protein BH23BAC4_BH23BAC4_06820 [soil metagenome]